MTNLTRTKPIRLSDVAKKAGVSSATVDRVLNERGNVSEAIGKCVLQAARELGLKRTLPLSHRRHIRIDVILARPELRLIARMNFEFQRLASSLDPAIVIHRTVLKDERPETLAGALKRTSCDAVVSYLPDHSLVHAAIEELRTKGIPVFTVISDVPGSSRIGYGGTDHYKAGRSAAYFIQQMAHCSGPLVVLCNHMGFQSHADRIRGLTDFLRERGPEMPIVGILEGQDDESNSEFLLRDVFSRHRDIVGIYNVGAANRAVARAIRANILDQPPVFIGHELTRETAEYLRQGVMSLAIDQSPELQVHLAIELVLRHFAFVDFQRPPMPPIRDVPSVLYGPENIPDPLPF